MIELELRKSVELTDNIKFTVRGCRTKEEAIQTLQKHVPFDVRIKTVTTGASSGKWYVEAVPVFFKE